MSPQQAVAVAVRLFGVWLAVYVVRSAPAFVLRARTYADGEAIVFAAVIGLGVIALVLALFFFPQLFARGLLAGQKEATLGAHSPREWFDVGCTLIGIWVLTDAIPGLIRYAIASYLMARDPATVPPTPDWPAVPIYYTVELGIGIWLFLGGAGLKRLITHLRYAGSE